MSEKGIKIPKRYPVSLAPMMDRTDRHFRYFLRLISKHTFLYTEMIHTGAILHGDRRRFLSYSPEELPLAIQLGGDNPKALAESSKIGEDYGYSEINLNVGCPSDRVREGNFGACLMETPERVAELVCAMDGNVSIPVTVKCRIGISGKETLEDLCRFIECVRQAGVRRFIVHARIAILGGLSPAQNRQIPPLRYAYVESLKKEFPDLLIEINGGIRTLAEMQDRLKTNDGVMIGRAAYETPYLFSEVDSLFFHDNSPSLSRREVLLRMRDYIEEVVLKEKNGKPHHALRHMLGLFHGQKGARSFRRVVTERMYCDYSSDLLLDAIQEIPNDTLDLIPSN
ncbi:MULTISPECIES: tRNA dihydrouridine(20/20a) synthase DusA [Leptospira]|uniref:tRNA-dihydrouridine(20/20a) synthase n=6 Tax=Leptospira TaxID=171 RepID=M3H2X4_LEPBO|nr:MULTISPECIES: tRNA dihydrouridine(20/20a) synthase DusA [Leptospira]EMG01444.1 tRNA dihydrouridine synthase A [Leptospira borgpetersenii str. 200701203]ALO24752.1 tRNA dihydrouridine synthase A [Leptospira borgpetersenii serovar Ballum]ANG99846.1 tRNA-dihydrouridine(20/20a) synthase [Leptospira borgpetersenii str. 4E]AXX14460.1 tRNA dihydrouridine(20/20a) synthase DusA [Leptospira borgpetersenii serovar Ceylonica]EKP12790.1 tRNA dihydrouridine synthase A [Leptospira borgpetersenii str. 2008